MTRSHVELPDQGLDNIPAYPMARAESCPLDPPPDLSALRSDRPLVRVRLWDGSTPWLATRYADQRALLADRRVSADSSREGYPSQSPSLQARRSRSRSFISMDDPEHARLRRMMTGAFTVRRIEGMRPGIQRIVDDLIDQMLAGPAPADLVAAFALPVPSLVICELLGVPYADHEFFQQASRTLINRSTPAETAMKAQDELTAYLDRLIERKLAEPGDDLLSRMSVERVATGQLTRRELAAMGVLLLIAGHETTANMIALGTYALLTHPDQLAAVRDSDDPQLIVRTVEELLRYLSIVHSGRRRVAIEDIEIAGEIIRAGEGIVLPNEIANRDTSVFPDPDRLDVQRDSRSHMAFGFGVHQCLGQPLARVELQVVYGTLYRRVPTLALAADPAQLSFKHDSVVYGLYELPVTW
ncbi:MAG TPA: cytochrome P450 [Trebonia sp.]|nr:cytochrome P450 [Trebonia sp.]